MLYFLHKKAPVFRPGLIVRVTDYSGRVAGAVA